MSADDLLTIDQGIFRSIPFSLYCHIALGNSVVFAFFLVTETLLVIVEMGFEFGFGAAKVMLDE